MDTEKQFGKRNLLNRLYYKWCLRVLQYGGYLRVKAINLLLGTICMI